MDRLITTSTVSTGKNELGLYTFVKALGLVWPELAEAGRRVRGETVGRMILSQSH